MKALVYFSVVGLLVSCKMGVPSDSAEDSMKNTIVQCEATSEKSGARIFEHTTVERKNGEYKIVYNFTTTSAGKKQSGRETIVGKLDPAEKDLSTRETISAVLKDAKMVTVFDDRDVEQSFDKLTISLDKGKLNLTDNGAVVLELTGCK